MNHCDYQIIEVNPKDLVVEPGFNPREAVIGNLCYEQEPVKSAIISIKQAYKEGRRVDLIKVVKKGSKYIVRQGHCRYRALLLAIAEGADIPLISVVIMHYKNKIEEYLENLDGNRNNSLNPVALAYALAETLKLGSSVESLAMRYQRSGTAIRNQLKILDMPLELQRLISLNLIKKTLAIEIMLKYSNDHAKVLAHLESRSFLMPSSKMEPVLTKPANVGTSSGNEQPDNQETIPVNVSPKENKIKSITRSSLGIKRLSHKKTERLRTEFIGLIDNVGSSMSDNNNKITELILDGQHSNLFMNISNTLITTTTESVRITLDESKLQLVLSLLNEENTAIIIPKSKVTELFEIRNLLTNE
ncbi:hypothetical protein EG703_04720 [Salmonella enterica]|nr:hypothetical protein [Salmonella enterica]